MTSTPTTVNAVTAALNGINATPAPAVPSRSHPPLKMLCVGESGRGKTGALAALAARGYKLRVWDYDKGLPLLQSLLTDPESPYVKHSADSWSRVRAIPFHTKIKNFGGALKAIRADAWLKSVEAFTKWKDDLGELPEISQWDSDTCIVIDSFTGANEAALDYQLQMNGRLGQQPWEADWGAAQETMRNYMEILTDPDVKCNVILNCHVKDVSKKDEPTKLMPWALGSKFPPDVPRFFNNMVEFTRKGKDLVILTKPSGQIGGINIKTSVIGKQVLDSYPIEWGLADLFKVLRGGYEPMPGASK